MAEYGIKETKEVVTCITALGNAIGKALEDGDLSIGDIGYLIDPMIKAPAAFENIAQVPLEIANLDPEEANELKEQIAGEFDIPQDKVEEIVEDASDIAVRLFAFVMKLRDM